MVKSNKLSRTLKSQRAMRTESIQRKRARVFETLERRELMANDFAPAVEGSLARMFFNGEAAYQKAGLKISGTGASGGGGSSGAGEATSSVNVSEIEPNNFQAQAQVLPVAANRVVNVSGSFRTFDDVDYFALDLNKGDILDTRISGVANIPSMALYDSSGAELVFAQGRFLGGNAYSTQSPLYRDGLTTLPYVIGTSGRYFLRVADGLSAYTLNVRVTRSTYEAEPVGTQQIMYIDFDGALTRSETLNLTGLGVPPGTLRVPPLSRYMPALGLTAADTPSVARNIMNRLDLKLRTNLAQDSNNGFYPETGNPGDFSVKLVSSFDSPDLFGQPNVSRVMVGGTQAEIGLDPDTGLLGIAQSVDLGNFGREESALVMLDIILADALTFPIAGNVTRADLFAELVSMVVAHEAGHTLGGVHQDPFNFIFTIMDQFYDPSVSSGAGVDGIFGNADDRPLRFLNDEFSPTAGVPFGGGVHNDPDTLAFGMSTGKIGGTIAGLVFNDANRNTRQDGSEAGLAGWTVFLDLNNDGIRQSGEPRATTDAAGRYSIRAGAGTNNVRVVYPAGWVASTPSEAVKSVTVTVNATASANFGATYPAVGATGFKWLDLNGDGVRDPNEPGLAGVYIYLDLDEDGRPDVGEPASISKADGSYSLTPPRVGTFQIREVVDPGYVQTYPASGFHTAVFGGATPLSGFDFGNRESSDWGDAPAPYPTTRAQNGASHGVVPGLRLGTNWDAELDGQQSPNADGDDVNGPVDDEDGITLLSPIVRGDSQNSIRINVTNTTGTSAVLQGWIDFNGNGSWSDAGEQIITNLSVSAGSNIVNFTAPSNAVSKTFARFRLSQSRDLAPTGRASTGEVEDYTFNIVDGPRRNLQDDVFTVARNSMSNELDVLANDFVPPSDSISAVLLGVPSQRGVATLGAGNIVRYTPARGFFGQETFSYTVVYGSGRRETANVTVNVALQFLDPVAIDDSFDLPTNSVSYPLNVLLNDIEGTGGALTVTSISTPDQGGSVAIGSGGLSIRYTPRRDFGGTERFTYTATDGTGKSTTAQITVHTLGGDRLDDDVQFSFSFFDMSGAPITRVTQGDAFQVYVYAYDLRPDRGLSQSPPIIVSNPGVYAAYLDVLYNANLVLPGSPGTNTTLDFANIPQRPYLDGISGTAQLPGVISSLGAFTGGSIPPFELDKPSPVTVLTFNARSAGIVEFVGDPANQSPNTDVVLYNPPNASVPIERVRYLRSSLEVVPRGVETPFAVDDSPAPLALNTTSYIDVLRNDIVGTAGPIRITSVTQPVNGAVSIDTRGTESPSDDRIQFVPVSSSVGFSDQFTYSIIDARGFTSTATVTVQVGDATADDKVRLTLRTTDVNGNVITSIPVGSEFELRGYVEDLRNPTSQSGVFAAYQDILYDRNLVAVKTATGGLGFDINFAAGANGYQQGKSGDILIPGLINEVGSFQDSLNPLGTSELLQFRIRLRANASGIAQFSGDPADISPFHDTLLYSDQRNKVPFNQITYVPAQILIGGGSSGGGGGGEGNTNLSNRFDVNSDGFVSPIDVLILVNLMNQGRTGPLDGNSNGGSAEGESGETYYVDVDGDGFLSPLDALLVINELNTRRGGGNGEGESSAAPLLDAPVTKFTSVPMPVLQTSLSRSAAFGNMGPQQVSNVKTDATSLDSYLASIADDSVEDEDYVDGLADDLLRVKW